LVVRGTYFIGSLRIYFSQCSWYKLYCFSLPP